MEFMRRIQIRFLFFISFDRLQWFYYHHFNFIKVPISGSDQLIGGTIYNVAGPSGNDSNGGSCAYWRYDSCQKNSTVLP